LVDYNNIIKFQPDSCKEHIIIQQERNKFDEERKEYLKLLREREREREREGGGRFVVPLGVDNRQTVLN